jgi:hypothetical protein
MRLILIFIALLTGFCAAALAQSWEGFPPYPGSKALCEQRLHGNTLEIHWTAHTSSDPPQVVTAFYEGKLGKPETDKGETRFRAAKEGAVERTLSVYPIGGSYPRCGKDPATNDRTMLIVSRAIAR